jgi:hypothetical protein
MVRCAERGRRWRLAETRLRIQIIGAAAASVYVGDK